MFAAVTAYMNFGRQFDPLIRSIWLVVHKHSSIDKMYQNHSAIIPKKKDSWAQFPNTLIQSIWGMSGVFVFSVYLCQSCQ